SDAVLVGESRAINNPVPAILDARGGEVFHDRPGALRQGARQAIQFAAQRLVDRLGNEVVGGLVRDLTDVGERRRDMLTKNRSGRNRARPKLSRKLDAKVIQRGAKKAPGKKRSVRKPAKVDILATTFGDTPADGDDQAIALPVGVN